MAAAAAAAAAAANAAVAATVETQTPLTASALKDDSDATMAFTGGASFIHGDGVATTMAGIADYIPIDGTATMIAGMTNGKWRGPASAKGPLTGVGKHAGWLAEHGDLRVDATNGNMEVKGDARAYLVEDMRSTKWAEHRFVRLDLTESELSFELDLSRVPCGCLATVYMSAMPDPGGIGAQYCDMSPEFEAPVSHLQTDFVAPCPELHSAWLVALSRTR
jgi:hypothetical protein